MGDYGGVAAGIGALGGSIIQVAAQNKANHDARNFALMQGDIEFNRDQLRWIQANQRADEVWERQNAYNLDMWNMQNKYNSPMAQMERFKEAGLNPNLIYGQNNTGGNVATANLESGKGGSGGRPGNWVPRVPEYDFEKGIMSYASFREQAARTDNLEKQREVMDMEKALKGAQMGNLIASTARTNLETKLATELYGTSVDAAKTLLEKNKMEIDIGWQRNAREALQNVSNLQEAKERIQNMRGVRLLQQQENELKAKELDLKRNGLNWNDPAVIRWLWFKFKQWGSTDYQNERKNGTFELSPDQLEE